MRGDALSKFACGKLVAKARKGCARSEENPKGVELATANGMRRIVVLN